MPLIENGSTYQEEEDLNWKSRITQKVAKL
jgi:hypothetical protein